MNFLYIRVSDCTKHSIVSQYGIRSEVSVKDSKLWLYFQPEAEVDIVEVLQGAIPLLEGFSDVRLKYHSAPFLPNCS